MQIVNPLLHTSCYFFATYAYTINIKIEILLLIFEVPHRNFLARIVCIRTRMQKDTELYGSCDPGARRVQRDV